MPAVVLEQSGAGHRALGHSLAPRHVRNRRNRVEVVHNSTARAHRGLPAPLAPDINSNTHPSAPARQLIFRRRRRSTRSLRGVKTVFDAPVDPALIERSLAASTFGSMWLDIPRPDYPTLTGRSSCDLLVVGGGYAGLWTALHATERNPGAGWC